jgi:hypothetical protein
MFTHPVCFLGAAGTSTPTLYNTLGLDIAETQYLSLTDSTDFNFNTAYTFCCWVYPTDLSVENGIYNQLGSSLNFAQMSILPTGKMSFKATYGGTIAIDIESDVTLIENNLYMIGFEVIGSTLSFIINGVHDDNFGSFAVAPTDLATNLQLARVHEGVNFYYFSGAFALPMAFQAALGPQALLDIYNAGTAKQPWCYDETTITDLYAFAIPLNDGSTTPLDDVSVNGNNAFLFGSPTPVYDGEQQEIITCATSEVTNTALLNGTDQYFSAGDVLDIGTSDYSGSIWFKTTSTGGALQSKAKSGSTPEFLTYIVTSSKIHFRCIFNVSNKSIFELTNAIITDGAWHHLVYFINRSANTCTAYLDGVLESTPNVSAAGVITGDITTTWSFNLGARLGADLFHDGELGLSGFSVGSDLTLDATELYNGGIAPCFDALAPATQSKFTAFWNIANWDVSTTGNELIDQAGSTDMTNGGATPFTGTGLDVECT